VEMTDATFHLASQTHVDRSYGDVLPFVNSNVVGAYAVLEAVRSAKRRVRCVFMSTDEVYGDVEEALSKETDPLAPRNIYSCLKASGDLLAQTYSAIFGLDVVIARPANNYGPRQFEEKLMPKILTTFLAARRGEAVGKVPIYGDGRQVRDWLYVKDTAEALCALRENGAAGEAYNLGAHQFRTVLEVVQASASLVGVDWEGLVEHTADRIRGDRRYALDLSKTREEIGWSATTPFDKGMEDTVAWYRARAGKA
jgi:dTDP-glucose 4,6-dehydratase